MEIIQEIGLKVIEMLTLIFGILGMAFSTMLMYSSSLTQNISNFVNRNVNVDEKIRVLDKHIEINEYLYSYHSVVGLLLIAGSLVALFFFYFSLDIANLTSIFHDSPKQVFFSEIFLNSILWVGKISCLAGFFIGSLLVFAPDKMKQWEYKLNTWVETGHLVSKLETSSVKVDTFIFRHPLPFGLTGAVISFFIITLSLMNLLD